MYKKTLTLFLLSFFCVINFYAQEEKYPIYSGCEQQTEKSIEQCFLNSVKKEVLSKLKLPKIMLTNNFKGTLNVVFIVNKNGAFNVIYAETTYPQLKKNLIDIFKNLPKAKPATYGNRPIEMEFVFPLTIPLDSEATVAKITNQKPKNIFIHKTEQKKQFKIFKPKIVKKAITKKGDYPEHKSALNIPFSQTDYAYLDYYYNKFGNSFTNVKPYRYEDATKYIDLDAQKNALLLPKKSWFGRKFFNEEMLIVKGNDYWFTLNPIADLQLGKDNSKLKYTYNNTRAVQIQGGLGSKFNFSSTIYESQGRFANYINQFILNHKPVDSNGLVPGRGRSKAFHTNGFDYPVAEGYLSYTPNHFFNFQFGNGKNFFGNGYRSLFLSDISSPYPYFKITTTFWKIRYTNLWLFLDDVRPEAQINGANTRKFVVMHHLSYNVNKRLNISLFESVISSNQNRSGLDINFVNPVIIFRPLEFARGESAGNELLGFSTKYKI